MSRLVVAALAACAALSACNVASVEEVPSTIALNQCTGDGDCAVGGVCDGGMCRSPDGAIDINTVLFEVTPPADGSAIAGAQFLRQLDPGASSDGDLNLSVGLLATLTGEVTLARTDCVPQFCARSSVNACDSQAILATSSDKTVPALVSLIPSSRTLGLFSQPTAAESVLHNSSSWQFSLNVPPGTYDIYFQPAPQPDSKCVLPPQLLLGQEIKGGKHGLTIKLPDPSSFEFHVSWPQPDGMLTGWLVDMLDPISGRVISNQVPLGYNGPTGTDYQANLSYLPVVGAASNVSADELVRLSPPPNVAAAPTVLMARSALSLFSMAKGTLTQFQSIPAAVHVAAQVTQLATPKPAAATVTFNATKITGMAPGVLASFVRTVAVGADGKLEVDLLPGTYRLSAVPTGNNDLAEVSPVWEVASTPSTQAGKVIELSQALPINGQAFDAASLHAVEGAQVQAVASPASVSTDVLRQALGETVYVPRASGSIVDKSGNFALSSDSGTFDISVRPQPSTGFAWLVEPSVVVGTTPATSNGLGLGMLSLPLPVVYRGAVTVPVAMGDPLPVPGALIRSYIYMKAGAYTSDASSADSVLQIAETRADELGTFQLLIPAALNAPSN